MSSNFVKPDMVEGYVDLEYFELPILIWNLMLAVCIVCKYEANFRELQRMSGIAHCSRQFVGGAGKAGRGIILLAVNAFVIFSVTRKGPEELSLPGTLIATHWNHWSTSSGALMKSTIWSQKSPNFACNSQFFYPEV